MDVDAFVSRIEEDLRAAGTQERAANEKRYLKSDLEHLGVTVPKIRNITRSRLREFDPDRAVVPVIESLWRRPIHELRMAAVEVANARVNLLEPADIAVIERLLRTSKTWALVDSLAVLTAGPLLSRHPDEASILDGWATDDDFWMRRSALLAHLDRLRQGEGDWERFCRYADAMLEEKEFFIRKAIGWVLRDTARKRPDLVYAWILPRAHRASGVTIREVVKRLPPHQAEAVKHAYQAGS